ncbi:hypothetical protein SD51_13115 [Alicyclobacillus tengchongensis]|nr:hypothetical protein SD51_13115 [Alicyclobacillus tengchongensis]
MKIVEVDTRGGSLADLTLLNSFLQSAHIHDANLVLQVRTPFRPIALHRTMESYGYLHTTLEITTTDFMTQYYPAGLGINRFLVDSREQDSKSFRTLLRWLFDVAKEQVHPPALLILPSEDLAKFTRQLEYTLHDCCFEYRLEKRIWPGRSGIWVLIHPHSSHSDPQLQETILSAHV